MADDLSSLVDPSAGAAQPTPQLPPQAQTGLPGQAADLADIAPAPSAADTLLQANFGDKGAEQYNNLRNAGRVSTAPPTGTTPLFGLSGAPSAEGLGNLVGATLAGAATGNPAIGLQQMQQRQQLQLAQTRELRENASEFYTALLPAAFKQFPGRPDLAAAFLQNEATRRGITINPAVAVKLNQDMLDGKLTPAALDQEIAHGNVSTIERLGTHAKFIDDLTKGRAEATKATAQASAEVAKAPYAGPMAQADLAEKQLLARKNQMDVDTFYDTLERQVVAEANKRGLKPGTAEYSNFVVNRKTQLDEWVKRQNIQNTPLTGREEEDFNQADRAGKFASEALKLLNDPSVAGNRGVAEGRLRNLAWRLGFAQSSQEDLYQSLSNLSGLMGSKVYSGGIRNMKWIDRVLEHTLRPGDELPLLKDKVNVLLRAAREQQQGILNTHGTAAGQMKPTVPEVSLPGVDTGTGGGGLSPAGQDYLSSLTTSAQSTPPPAE